MPRGRFKVPGKNIVAQTSRSAVSPVCDRQPRDYSRGLGQFRTSGRLQVGDTADRRSALQARQVTGTFNRTRNLPLRRAASFFYPCTCRKLAKIPSLARVRNSPEQV